MEEIHREFLGKLIQAWSPASSSLWSENNPARGHCGVTALVVQDRFGGRILKTRTEGSEWHFYNEIDGLRLDLTAQQFDRSLSYDDVIATRAEAFSDTNKDQYEALSKRLSDVKGKF